MKNPDFTKLDYTPIVEQPSYAAWRALVEAETGRPAEEFVWQTLEQIIALRKENNCCVMGNKALFSCAYLGSDVELTDERFQHIVERHPDLLPEYLNQIGETLADPEQVRRSDRFGNARLFTRWFEDVRTGKHIVVVVVSETAPKRHWVITAYLARRLSGGTIEWTKS